MKTFWKEQNGLRCECKHALNIDGIPGITRYAELCRASHPHLELNFDIERNKSKKRRAEKAERLSKTVGIEKRRNTTCTHRIST
jgi:hypothetical protein